MALWQHYILVLLISGIVSGVLVWPLNLSRKVAPILSLVLMAAMVAGYYQWGGIVALQDKQVQAIQLADAKRIVSEMGGTDNVIAALIAKIEKRPNDAKGWYLLGRLYAAKGDWKRAVSVYEKAHHLAPDNEQYTVNYAFGLWQVNSQHMNQQARAIYMNLLKSSPNQPDALSMLAMDAYDTKQYSKAIVYWQQLLQQTAPNSEVAQSIERAITKAEQHRLKQAF